jgi:lipopolysaccharide export system permease protein
LKILTKYTIKELLGPLFFGLFAFISIFLGYLFIDLLRDAEKFHFGIIFIIKLISLRIPEYMIHAAPIAVLLAALLGLGNLTSHSETIAMRAGGLSFGRLAIPVLILGLAVSLSCLALNEYLVPVSLRTYEQLKQEATTKEAKTAIRHFLQDFYDQSGRLDKLVYADRYEPKSKTMYQVVIQEFKDGKLVQTVAADVMFWKDGSWFFNNGRIYQYTEEKDLYPIISEILHGQVRRYGLSLTPKQIERSRLSAEKQSISELIQLSRFMRTGDEKRQVLIQLHTKFAIPFASLVLALLGTPLALRPQRRSNAAGFGLCIIFIILWYTLMGIGAHLASAGAVSPFLGAWLPNILLAGYGISVFVKVKS